jgi:flagellar hook-associated protein 1
MCRAPPSAAPLWAIHYPDPMSNLFSALHSASAALNVFTQALGVEQSNVANASTAGFAAQRANINAINVSGIGATGDFITVTSNASAFADASVRAASSQSAGSQTRSGQLAPVNQLFDITGATGILAAFQKFSTAFSNLSVNPNDATLGSLAVSAAGNVASAFQTVAAGLDSQRNQADTGIRSVTDQINGLSAKIRQLNVQAGTESQIDPGTDANLRNALDQLSSLVDITVTRSPNGSVSVLAGGQLPLVIGDQAYTLSANPAAAAGLQISSSAGGHSPATFSGQLGALIETRNGTLDQVRNSLNDLAAGFGSRVNTLLTSGVNASGVAGVPLFTFDPANPAGTLAIDSSVTPGQLGLATTAQSNGIANQLAALAGSSAAADQISGLSPEGLFGSIAASIGQQLSDANTAATADQSSLTFAQTSRQQASGVSLDVEAVAITAFERAYQANSQVVTVINNLTNVAVNLLGPTGG